MKSLRTTTLKRRRGRPVNEARKDEILSVAGNLFILNGVSGTSMEQIARDLGISKLTLYSRFEHKEALFAAVIEAKCQEFIPDIIMEQLDTNSPESSLKKFAHGLMKLLMSEEAIGMERMLMGMTGKDRARLSALFYEAGPERTKQNLQNYLKKLNQSKILKIPDPHISAELFVALIKGSDPCFRKAMGVDDIPSEEYIKKYVRYVVKMFINFHC